MESQTKTGCVLTYRLVMSVVAGNNHPHFPIDAFILWGGKPFRAFYPQTLIFCVSSLSTVALGLSGFCAFSFVFGNYYAGNYKKQVDGLYSSHFPWACLTVTQLLIDGRSKLAHIYTSLRHGMCTSSLTLWTPSTVSFDSKFCGLSCFVLLLLYPKV